MSWMTELFPKMGFDCASINEMETVRKISKKIPWKILFHRKIIAMQMLFQNI